MAGRCANLRRRLPERPSRIPCARLESFARPAPPGNAVTRRARQEGTMGRQFDRLDASLTSFIGRQHMFFVGTAPTSPDGHLNISPKGLDTFRILSPEAVAYLDLTGSGIETVAHLRENGRITIMFCAFDGRPMIVRLHLTRRPSRRASRGSRLERTDQPVSRVPRCAVGGRGGCRANCRIVWIRRAAL